MRTPLRLLGITLAVLVIVYLAGPRVEVDDEVVSAELPAELDRYLADAEAAYSDIIPGAERRIVWAGEPGARTARSVVYLHGFSSSPPEAAPLPQRVADALGANLYLPRMTGHGRTGEALAAATVNDWLRDATEAMAIARRLGGRTVLIGTSQGGALATWVAGQPELRGQLEALVLMSPNYGPREPGAGLLAGPWGRQLAHLVIGETRTWEPANEGQAEFWTESYPVEAVLPAMGLMKLALRIPPDSIRTPTLLIYSNDDRVIRSEEAVERVQRFGAPRIELLAVDDSGDPFDHVLAGDILSPGTTDRVVGEIIRFVRGGS